MRIAVISLTVFVLLFRFECAVSQTLPPNKMAVTAEGLVGNLYTPAIVKGRLPAVIVLGGSEGGLGEGAAIEAELIARHGYVVLHLGYFDVPGRPQNLEVLPIEYFKTAIDWLRAQPLVIPEKIGIVGTSKGGEAALVVASHYAEVKVVVAGVSSNVVWPGIRGAKAASSWTLGGKDLPMLPYGIEGGFTSIFAAYENGLKKLDQYPQAIIAVEHIAGPVILICGEADALWPSCSMSKQVVSRLKTKRFKHKVTLLAYADAGHASFGPPVPIDSERFLTLGDSGGTSKGNYDARNDSWPKVLAFLDVALKH